MKSFIEIEYIQERVEIEVEEKGKKVVKTLNQYPETGIADMLAQWLIEISSSRQNKYVVCKNWEATRNKDFSDRGINDLSIEAQCWVFTMAHLIAATKDNAVIPSRDDDENTLAKHYMVPSNGNINALMTYSHRVGLSELLAETDKFVLHTKNVIKIDKSKVISPDACNAFIKTHKNCSSTDAIETTLYQTSGVKVVTQFEGFYTKEDFSKFETTLIDNISVKKELSQILLITGTIFENTARLQETVSNEVLIRWLAKAEAATKPETKN